MPEQRGLIVINVMGELDQVALREYDRARSIAALRGLVNWLLRRSNDLLVLDSVLRDARLKSQHGLGIRAVPIDEIVGSGGRTDDFDRAFYPRRDVTQEKWISVDKASREGVPLPTVELRKVNEHYFVMDGHHRISVARQHEQRFIDAYVVKIIMTRRI
jgi:hypothetical protein